MPHGPAFSTVEYERRIRQTRAAMAEAGIEVAIVTDPSNQGWLTGYDGWSFYVHQAVILPSEGPAFWWGRRQDANGAARTVDRKVTEIRSYPDHYVQSDALHPMQHLAEVLLELGLGTARIGVEMDNYYFSAKAYVTLQGSLPGADIVDSAGLVNWQRAVKSAEELDFMRRAARIADRVVNTALEVAEPGLRKNELAAKVLAAGALGAGDDWGDYPAIMPILPSGDDTSAPHLNWNGDAMVTGEATFFELAGCYRRYHIPLSRTVFLGKPSDQMLRAEEALLEGLEAGLDKARAGNRACDISDALGRAMERAGIDRAARCGYSIGLSYPPDWGERTISLRGNDDTILRPNMCFHFMPGIWMDGWGMEITESIVIREDGPADCFCTVPRKLVVKN